MNTLRWYLRRAWFRVTRPWCRLKGHKWYEPRIYVYAECCQRCWYITPNHHNAKATPKDGPRSLL